MMHHPKLQAWIVTPASSALFVHGNHKPSTRQQPTAFVCAKLVRSIQAKEDKPSNTIALSFFCGEHVRSNDPDSGVDGLMRNLLAQLLTAYLDFDLRAILRMRDLDYHDVGDLCAIFERLVMQLPPHIVVFCVIDNINIYEDNAARCEDAELVMQTLVDVVERTRDESCAFKVLLTSPWNSHVLYKHMSDQNRDVVWMPARIPLQGGFTESKWGAIVDRNVTSLSPDMPRTLPGTSFEDP